jgi:hypothetical protein
MCITRMILNIQHCNMQMLLYTGVNPFYTVTVKCKKKKVKLSLYQAVENHWVVRRQGSHIFYTIGSQIAVRL